MKRIRSLFRVLTAPIRRWWAAPWWLRVISVLVVIVLAQQLIPSGTIVPRATVSGKELQASTLKELSRDLNTTDKVISLTFGEQTVRLSLAEVGISVDTEATLAKVPSISTTDKFVPLLPAIKSASKPTVSIVYKTDANTQAALAQRLAQQYTTAPKDATAVISEDKLIIQKESPGYRFTQEEVLSRLKRLQPLVVVQSSVPAKTDAPGVTTKDFDAIKATFQQLEGQKLTVAYGATTKQYDAMTVRKWLEVKRAESGQWQIGVSGDRLKADFDGWAKDFNIPAGTTQVTTMDGVETSRKTGASGRALDLEGAVKQFTEWVNKPSANTVTVASKVLAPKVVYSRFYSASSAGLQAKLDAWIGSHSGKYQVAIVELGGQGRKASYNVSQQTVMASTYKLFLAFAAYQQSEVGALNLNTKLSCGKTIEGAIEIAIVNSDNDCAIALGKYIGWAKVDQIIAAAGFQGVKLNNYTSSGALSGDKMVNANELAKFLAQLSGGSLMNSDNTNKLLGYMKRQVYRQGIPAGSHGATVADKVGFLEGYLHDAAIVYAPNATYALVIMSSGSSWSNISSLADAVYSFMNG